MDTDLALVLGIVIAGFAIPSIISAAGDGRRPWASGLTILISGGLVYYALTNHPGGYALEDVPNAFVRIVAKVL